MFLLPSLALLMSKNAAVNVVVDFAAPRVEVSHDLYGIFFEEINCAGDGGLFAELIRNRSFEDSDKPEHWTLAAGSSGSISVEKYREPSGYNHQYLSLRSDTSAGVVNGGYWGINAIQGDTYNLSFQAWAGSPGKIVASLKDSGGKSLASESIDVTSSTPSTYTAKLKLSANEPKASLSIELQQPGSINLDMVSLFPEKLYKSSLLRPDLASKLHELKPGFMRFPGGCWVEGDTMAFAQRWKTTIGDPAQRRTQPNLWGYQSCNGLGFHEYLQLCEDIGAAPLFVINCGMSHKEVVPMAEMDEYVQDALDAIEYANGPADSKWGSERAKNGHPTPFNLKYMEIGNENGGPAYEERYPLFYHAIKAKYPEVILIADVWGGYPQKSPVDVVDEHYYSNPAFFFQNEDKYDHYDRKGPKIYVGEYAVTQDCGNGNLGGALAEAAFMMGMERNSDVVKMASYAPLFANINQKAWNPDLIYFDSSRVCGTPSFHVQKLFANNLPKEMLKTSASDVPVTKQPYHPGGIGLGTWHTQAEFKDIKVVSKGKVVFDDPSGKEFKPDTGEWKHNDGSIEQTSNAEPSRAFVNGDWSEYKLTLKARKIGGAEGFLVSVGYVDNNNYLWFNVGGWQNSLAALEFAKDGARSTVGKQVPSHVETGRWYDIEVDYSADHVICSIDGKVIFQEGQPQMKKFFVNAGVAGQEVVLKILNAGDDVQEVAVDLSSSGWKNVAGSVETISGENKDENTVDRPNRIEAKRAALGLQPVKFKFKAKARSINLLRLKSGATR